MGANPAEHDDSLDVGRDVSARSDFLVDHALAFRREEAITATTCSGSYRDGSAKSDSRCQSTGAGTVPSIYWDTVPVYRFGESAEHCTGLRLTDGFAFHLGSVGNQRFCSRTALRSQQIGSSTIHPAVPPAVSFHASI